MVSVLQIQDLHVSYRSRDGAPRPALAGVSLSLLPGEILGVLGESGSGKSTLAAAVVRLLPPNGHITGGAILLEGKDLLRSRPEELRQIRGARIALIFQEPSLALHPTMRAGKQVRQVLAAHSSPGKRTLNERTRQVFAAVFPEEADRLSQSYPHQLSGGQRQRVLIAQAIACRPCVIIADEPTASLDPTTQMEILGLFRGSRCSSSHTIRLCSAGSRIVCWSCTAAASSNGAQRQRCLRRPGIHTQKLSFNPFLRVSRKAETVVRQDYRQSPAIRRSRLCRGKAVASSQGARKEWPSAEGVNPRW